MLDNVDRNTAQQLDPVCGMMVDPLTAAGQSEYGGHTYYFCSPGCKRSFDADPERYLGPGGKQQTHSD